MYRSNKHNIVSGHPSHYIYEISRKNLVGKTKALSPTRYNKRVRYSANEYKGIDVSELLSDDMLVSKVRVKDYICTIAFEGVLHNVLNVVSRQPKHNVTLQSVIRALNQAIDKTDILVDCSCPDFIYRFSYYATKFGYKYGKPENRPPKITNPRDKLGAMCKHLTALLANKRWLVKLASIVNDFIKAYYQDIVSMLGVSEDEFYINEPGRPSIKTNRNTRMINEPDLNTNSIDNQESEEPEELELLDSNKEDTEEGE